MTRQAKLAFRRRCAVNQIMRRDESYRERLNKLVNLFPVHVKVWR